MTNITELETKYKELGKEIEKLKTKECEYPKFFRHGANDFIVKFTGLKEGEEIYSPIASRIGFISNNWVPHTDIRIWEEIPYDKETGFYHKQLVWCWDNKLTHGKCLGFYDVLNKRTFSYEGKSDGSKFDNYEAYDWSCDFINEWAIEAVKTLKDK